MTYASFEYREGRKFPLFDHPYNATITNERAVEIPIAMDFVARYGGAPGRGLEVGNVMLHYWNDFPPRRIVDKYEEHPFVDNLDVFAIDGHYDWIVSVSTLEHIRYGPGEPRNEVGAIAALHYLRGLLRPGGAMLVTVGMGQHPTLDWYLRHLTDRDGYGDYCSVIAEGIVVTTMMRDRTDDPAVNAWHRSMSGLSAEEVPPYGPEHGANAVWIGEWTA